MIIVRLSHLITVLPFSQTIIKLAHMGLSDPPKTDII
jgi:hypothetical protein